VSVVLYSFAGKGERKWGVLGAWVGPGSVGADERACFRLPYLPHLFTYPPFYVCLPYA
jgi:hypothetical protein